MKNLSKKEYKKALQSKHVLKGKSLELLGRLNDAISCGATAKEISNIFGYSDFPPVNSIIGKLGKRIQKSVNPKTTTGNWNTIADGKQTERGFVWVLKKELRDALLELGMINKQESKVFPEEVSQDMRFPEGSVKKITVNAYERNQTARKLCIKYQGSICKVCNFDFERAYGALGKGFIHVHHIYDLSKAPRNYQVDPAKDLVPVCPNCHAMLHSERPAISVETLKKSLKGISTQEAASG
jgi:predicted HNH restriction endonuclease